MQAPISNVHPPIQAASDTNFPLALHVFSSSTPSCTETITSEAGDDHMQPAYAAYACSEKEKEALRCKA